MNPIFEHNAPDPLVLHLGPAVQRMSDEEFYRFCQLHPDLRIERTSEGDLIIMPPTGGETGRRNFTISGLFFNWLVADGTGVGFDSSTEFALPDGAHRSPDVAWIRRERWDALTTEERKKFPPLCPDFVIELRSDTDRLTGQQAVVKFLLDRKADLEIASNDGLTPLLAATWGGSKETVEVPLRAEVKSLTYQAITELNRKR